MLKRTLQFIAGCIVLLLPFWPLTENFFPVEAQVDGSTFFLYILLCIGIVLVALGLIYFLKPQKTVAGWLLFAIGMVALFALHLGPPRESPELLPLAYIEKFRYGMLIVAVLLFFAGSYKAVIPAKTLAAKSFVVFLVVSTLANLWDNFSSFMFSNGMQEWVDSGKKAADFFTYYDYAMVWRAVARASLYVAAIWLSLLLTKRSALAKWQFGLLTVFSVVGILFCGLSLLIGPDYYFPFMVPAIALAPSYWIGLSRIL